MENDSSGAPKSSLTQLLFAVFLRLVAVSCFWFGLQYWAMLVGYSMGGTGRFDLLSAPWKVAGSALAVAFPVAALGLWLTVSWGAVIWAFAAIGQMLMYLAWPEIFGRNLLVPLMHGAVIAVYVLFRVALWLERRERAARVSSGLP